MGSGYRFGGLGVGLCPGFGEGLDLNPNILTNIIAYRTRRRSWLAYAPCLLLPPLTALSQAIASLPLQIVGGIQS